jgi:hypothetical protein
MNLTLRKITRELNDHHLVHKAILSVDQIHIRYKTGLLERWFIENTESRWRWHYALPEDPGKIEDVSLEPLYELNPLDAAYDIKKDHFIVRYDRHKKLSFVSKRLIVHEIITEMLKDGSFRIQYPRKELVSDFIRVKSDNLDRFKKGKGYRFHGAYSNSKCYGHKLIEHFMSDECDEDRAFNLYKIITQFNFYTDATKSTIMRNSRYFWPPNAYKMVFDNFDLGGKHVVDLFPWYSKSIAMAMLNCEYYCEDIDKISPIMEFLGSKASTIEDRRYDIAILDFDYDHIDYDLLERWIDRSDNQIIFVPKDEYEEFCSMFEILESVMIDVTPIESQFDYMVLI